MQLDAAVDDGCHGDQGAHVGVHLLVHQPEGQGLVPDQSLGGTDLERRSISDSWVSGDNGILMALFHYDITVMNTERILPCRTSCIEITFANCQIIANVLYFSCSESKIN